MKTTVPRSERSLHNQAWTSLGQAEAAWVRFTTVLEALARLHSEETAGPSAREVGERMHKFREVLAAWVQD